MTRLYGKDELKALLDSIAAQNRLSHAILLHGENGSGRLTTARYIAKLMMCGAPPCESCSCCKRIDENSHPDVIYAKRFCDDKYEIKKVRELIGEDASIKPNDSNVKIYIFEDADTLSSECQNTLLKCIEEPASYLRFIFLCENINNILVTIQSRVTAFDVPTPSVEACTECLIEKGTPSAKAKELAELTSGNIGKCVELLENGDEVKLIDTARKAAAALAKKDGLTLLAALSEQTGRNEFASMLEYFAGILRDALAYRCGTELTSCGKAEAQQLAAAYSEGSIVSKLECVLEIISHKQYNLNLALTAAQLTSKLGSR